MRTCIFDLETFSLHADTGLLLCAVIKEYQSPEQRSEVGQVKSKVFRADQYKTWKSNRTDCRPIVKDVIEALADYDIFVAHNGTFFDRSMLVSWALKYNLPVALRFAKFIDPCQLSRRHLKLARNSLDKLIHWLDVPQEKTDILWEEWMRASIEGSKKSMDYIVEHCVADVVALEMVYDKMRRLVKGIDEKGSSF